MIHHNEKASGIDNNNGERLFDIQEDEYYLVRFEKTYHKNGIQVIID